MTEFRPLLREMYFRAIAEVRDPNRLLKLLPPPPAGRTLVLAAGKAAAEMARTVERVWEGPLSGLVVTPPGYDVPLSRIESLVAGHPVPDRRSAEAAARFLTLASDLTADDLALALLSGGGSALLAGPAPGLTLGDKQAVTRTLFAAGADIREINTVRRHLSAIKGGRLARAAAPARVVTRVISDVAGDDPGVIASGPTAGDITSAGDALDILRRHAIRCPERVLAWLTRPEAETPKPDDPDMATADLKIIATGRDALKAAADLARSRGLTVYDLGDRICGEARGVARDHAEIARGLAAEGGRHVILSGGEVTVTLGAATDGAGGPNREYALALALHLKGHPAVEALAADTDGIDGTAPAAGAFVMPDTLSRAQSGGLNPRAMLDKHQSGTFFDRLGDSFVTGPTRTNVNDFRAITVNGTFDG